MKTRHGQFLLFLLKIYSFKYSIAQLEIPIPTIKTALNGIIKKYTYTPTLHTKADPTSFMELLNNEIKKNIEKDEPCKFYSTLNVNFTNIEEKHIEAAFHSKTLTYYDDSDINNLVSQAQTKIQSSLEKFTSQGSGWVMDSINNFCLCVVKI